MTFEGPAPPPPPSRSGLAVVAVGLFILLMASIALLVAFSFPAGVYTVFFTHLSNVSDASTLATPYIWLGTFPVLTTPLPIGEVFIVLVAIYVAFFILATSQGKTIRSALDGALKVGIKEIFTNNALVALVSIGFIIFTATTIDLIVTKSGSTIGNPFSQDDPLKVMVGLALAPLREEFGFRVLLVGTIAFAVSVTAPRVALKSLWRPSAAFEASQRTAVEAIVWVAVAASSLLFGACHVGIACGGGGWDLGKLPEATYGGVVLGFIYVKYGFHIAAITHWGIDYFASVYAFFGQGVQGIYWTSAPGYFLQDFLTLDAYLLFGAAAFVVVIYVGAAKLLSSRTKATEVLSGSS